MEFTAADYPCACCNSTATKPLVSKNGFSIVQCCNCKFVYVNPRIKNEDLENIYKHNYFKSKDYGYLNYEQEERLRIKNFERWLRDAEWMLPESNTINALDVGCAAGYCLDVMQLKGWNAEGLELDEEVYAGLINAGKKVHRVQIKECQTNKKYQVITLFDVIEHIPEIDLALTKLSDLLDDNGIIVMVTPNYESKQRKFFGKRWFQYKPIEHIQYFTKQHLDIFAKRSNLKIVYHSTCGQYADLQFLINRLKYYHFSLPSAALNIVSRILHLRNLFFYTDTGSLFLVLKKVDAIHSAV